MNPIEEKGSLDFPNMLNVCVLKGDCPCSCVHCPVGITPVEERREVFGYSHMEFELFKKIIDETARFKPVMKTTPAIRIHSVGEPLLWKNLEKAVEYSASKDVVTWLFSSFVTESKIRLESIARNCSIIEVSVNSFDAENYLATKGVDKFDLVYSNIKYVSDFIKQNNLKTRLIATRVESSDKKYNSDFIEFWNKSGLVADSFVRDYHNYNGAISAFKDRKRDIVPCLVHWSRFNIDSNGDVLVCFNELFKPAVDKTLIYGNLNEVSISDIWHGNKMHQIRKAQLNKDYGVVKFTNVLPCKDCVYCQSGVGTTSECQVKKLK